MLHRFGRNKSLLTFILALAVLALVGVSMFLTNFVWEFESWDILRGFAEAFELPETDESVSEAEMAGAQLLLFIFGVLSIIGLIYLIIRRPAIMIANIILMVVLLLLFQGITLSLETPPSVGTESAPIESELILEPVPYEPLVDTSVEPPRSFTYLVAMLMAAIAAFVAWRWPRKSDLNLERDPYQSLQQDAAAALTEIQAGSSLRDAILNCYAKMVDTVQENRGIGMSKTVTAREFESRLLARGMPQNAVQRLTRLFESARYSNEAMGERDRLEAISCLSEVADVAQQTIPQEQVDQTAWQGSGL